MVYICAILSSIISTIIVAWPVLYFWLKKRLEKSIQHEYDRQLEKFKGNCQQIINKSNISYSLWQSECMKAIKDIFATLSELSLALEHYIPIILPVFTNENEKREFFKPRYENLDKVYKNALHTWYPNRIFLEKELNKKIDDMLFTCRTAVGYQNMILSSSEQIEDFSLKIDRGKPYDYINEFEDILNILSDKFQNILQREHLKTIE